MLQKTEQVAEVWLNTQAINHEYKGRKKYLVHNQLVMGDKVIMLKETGGQRYIALDRWYNPNRGARLSNGR